MKLNYLSLFSALLAISGLILPWLTVTSNANYVDPPIAMAYTAYLHQLTGTINGISQTVTPTVWFLWSALILIILSSLGCSIGSLLIGRKGQILILVSGITALLSIVVFGAGLLNSNFVVTDLEPGYVMNLFPPNTLGLTAEYAMQYGYEYSWYLGYGFWVTLVSAVLAFISLVIHPMFV
jgi:hypothetical protein